MEPSNSTIEIQNQEPKKTSKAPVIVAGVASALAVAGLAFGIFGLIQNNSKDQEISNLKTQIAKDKGSSTTTENNKGENLEETEANELVTTGSNSDAYSAKQILLRGTEEITGFRMTASQSVTDYNQTDKPNYHIEASQVNRNDGKHFQITVAKEEEDPGIFSYIEDARLDTTFDKEVRSVVPGGRGQWHSPVILFIFVDGTVKYIELRNYNASTPLEIKDMPDVSGVIGATSANAFPLHAEAGGYYTTLLQRANGEYYDLAEVLDFRNN